MARLPKLEGPWWEATKKIVRIFVFAGISGVVAYILDLLAAVPSAPVVVGLTAILEWANQYLREQSKARKDAKIKGLLPF